MGICELLTIVFVVLKLCGVIAWAWVWVLFPEILAIGFYIILFIIIPGGIIGHVWRKSK